MSNSNSSFFYIANNLGVDFVNTELISNGSIVNLLNSEADLLQWAADAGLMTEGNVQNVSLDLALELRAALKESFSAAISNSAIRKNALLTINSHLLNYSTQQVLQVEQNGYVLQPREKHLTFPGFLGCIAHQAASLLASPNIGRLKRCGNPECVLIFVDTSRAQKRRWCSMEICGNRAKAAKHYRKSLQ